MSVHTGQVGLSPHKQVVLTRRADGLFSAANGEKFGLGRTLEAAILSLAREMGLDFDLSDIDDAHYIVVLEKALR